MPAGRLGTGTWFNASAFGALGPSDGNVSQLLAAVTGELATLPSAVVALFSPSIEVQLTPGAYAAFKSNWLVGGQRPTATCALGAWARLPGESGAGHSPQPSVTTFHACVQGASVGGVRRLDVIAWSINKGDSSTGTVVLNDSSWRVTAEPPEGTWHRVAQVQHAVAPAAFRSGLK